MNTLNLNVRNLKLFVLKHIFACAQFWGVFRSGMFAPNPYFGWVPVNSPIVQGIPGELSAIYALAIPSSSGRLILIYIGETGDLRRRLRQHQSEDQPNLELLILTWFRELYFTAWSVPEFARASIEAHLIQTFQPVLNIQHNPNPQRQTS